MHYWLCYGPQEKWQATVAYSRWGVKSRIHNGRMSAAARAWESVMPGDVLVFKLDDGKLYGWARVKATTDSELRPIFPKELAEDAVIYDRRILFDFIQNRSLDGREPVKFDALEALKGTALSEIEPILAETAIAAMREAWESQAKSEFIQLLALHLRRDYQPEAALAGFSQ
ncbi:MAG TPA: hypothetical protein PKV72_04715 [Candidatus Peribacteria bacterium]|nr:hypothetical protein [Candidatus Peribacteria bacterium]